MDKKKYTFKKLIVFFIDLLFCMIKVILCISIAKFFKNYLIYFKPNTVITISMFIFILVCMVITVLALRTIENKIIRYIKNKPFKN